VTSLPSIFIDPLLTVITSCHHGMNELAHPFGRISDTLGVIVCGVPSVCVFITAGPITKLFACTVAGNQEQRGLASYTQLTSTLKLPMATCGAARIQLRASAHGTVK
jgi:hypothetical protein